MDKIIVITSNIAPYRLAWCEELSRYFDVTIAYTKDHDFERDDRWLQSKSEKCRLYKLKNDNDIYDPLCFDVIDLIKDNKDSLIIFDGYGPKTNLLGLLYCKIKGRYSITNVDGYPTERKVSMLKEMVKKFVIRNLCSAFFCGGESVKQHLMSYGADKDEIAVHNFSSIHDSEILNKPVDKKQKRSIRKQLGMNSDKKIVLGVGRFLPLKRFEDLIKAVKKCKMDCSLYLLGGKATDDYLKLIDDKDDIHFIDFVLPEDVFRYYQAADLFVLPSETDVWGLVLNEAMSQGLPVIASDSVVGARSLVRDNGKIFTTYDVDELSDDIDICLDDVNNKKMSKASLNIIKDFTIEGMVERQLPFINRYFKKEK